MNNEDNVMESVLHVYKLILSFEYPWWSVGAIAFLTLGSLTFVGFVIFTDEEGVFIGMGILVATVIFAPIWPAFAVVWGIFLLNQFAQSIRKARK